MKSESKWDLITQEYKIIQKLGSGIYGKVVLAICRDTDKKVAIKLIDDIFNSEDQPRYVIRELNLLH